jgi:hypothetical protein
MNQEINEQKEQEIFSDQFGEELSDFLDKYRGKLNPIDITYHLILEAKIEMCCTSNCYYHTLGILTDLFNHRMEEMWEEINREDKSEEVTNASNTL